MAQKIGMVTTRHEHINCFHYLPHSRNNTAKKKKTFPLFLTWCLYVTLLLWSFPRYSKRGHWSIHPSLVGFISRGQLLWSSEDTETIAFLDEQIWNHTKVFGDSTKYYSHEWPRQSSSKSPKLFLSFVSAPALFLCSLQNISALLNLIKQWDYSVAFSKHETWQKLNRVRDFWLWDINMNCLYKHCILEKKP